MNIVLFDRINEEHVCIALQAALRHLGHQVHATGEIWRGHKHPSAAADMERVEAALAAVIAAAPDALFNFRAATLNSAQLSRLRAAGIATAVWLPDDPVLYGVTYRQIVDHYDHVLHCGPTNVLEFYAARGHRPGLSFPFWLDPEQWASEWSPEGANDRLVFLGNLHGPAKRGRYARLSEADAKRIVVYGKCIEDPSGIHRGELFGVQTIRAVLASFAAGLNLAQRFAEYAGTAYDFPGLSELGSFELPSRVLQYAAIGLPVISLGDGSYDSQFPQQLRVADMREALAITDKLRADPERARALSARARAEVIRHFSGQARARLLIALFSGELAPAQLTIVQRAALYRDFLVGAE